MLTLMLGQYAPAKDISFGDATSNSFHDRLLLASTKTEDPRGSGDVATAQVEVQVTSDIDFDKLGQPHTVRHAFEPFD